MYMENLTLGQAIDELYGKSGVTYIAVAESEEDDGTIVTLDDCGRLTLKDGRNHTDRDLLTYLAEHQHSKWLCG